VRCAAAWHPQTASSTPPASTAGRETRRGRRLLPRALHRQASPHGQRAPLRTRWHRAGFTDPLDAKSATDPGNYSVTAWNYKWTANYGSPDFKLNDQEGRDTWRVESATLSPIAKTVFLKVPDAQRVMQLHVVFKLAFADGAKVENFVHGTIHNLDTKSGADWLGIGTITRAEEAQVKVAQEAPG